MKYIIPYPVRHYEVDVVFINNIITVKNGFQLFGMGRSTNIQKMKIIKISMSWSRSRMTNMSKCRSR